MPDLLDRRKAALADRYRVDREIGRGAMTHVFLAQDLTFDRPVALKVLRPALAVALGGDRLFPQCDVCHARTPGRLHPGIMGFLTPRLPW